MHQYIHVQLEYFICKIVYVRMFVHVSNLVNTLTNCTNITKSRMVGKGWATYLANHNYILNTINGLQMFINARMFPKTPLPHDTQQRT